MQSSAPSAYPVFSPQTSLGASAWASHALPGPSASFFDTEYPSPAPSSASPTYPAPDHYPLLSFPQIDSAIGPSRLRRPPRDRSHSSPSALQRQRPLYPTVLSPDLPAIDPPHRERLSIQIEGPPLLPSPTYHPITPTSMSSPSYSYYPAPDPHPRTAPPTAVPDHSPHRAPSPTLSVVSALTSVSDASHPPHFRPYPRPVPPLTSPRTKQKKQRLDNNARKNICLYQMHHPNARQEDIASVFKVERSTISKILKHKSKWLNIPDNLGNRVAKHRPSKFPEIEDALIQWLEECSAKKITLSDNSIRGKAKETARMLHISEEKFKASSGWVENFKTRHGIRAGVWANAGKHLSSSHPRVLSDASGPSTDPSSVLPPLNSAFTPTPADESPLDRSRHDDESNTGSPEPEDRRQQHQPPPLIVQPPWSDHSASDTVQGDSASPTLAPSVTAPSSHSPTSASLLHPSSPSRLSSLHTSSHHTHHHHSSSSHQHDREYLDETSAAATAMYYSTAHLPTEPSLPTLADAEEAINTLITFIDSAGQGILQDHERQTLTTIKCALFQAASGVPFDRGRH